MTGSRKKFDKVVFPTVSDDRVFPNYVYGTFERKSSDEKEYDDGLVEYKEVVMAVDVETTGRCLFCDSKTRQNRSGEHWKYCGTECFEGMRELKEAKDKIISMESPFNQSTAELEEFVAMSPDGLGKDGPVYPAAPKSKRNTPKPEPKPKNAFQQLMQEVEK